MKYIYRLLPAFLPFFSFGQLTLGGSNPQDVSTILSGSGVTISNVQHNGTLDAIAYFSASTYNMPIQSGFLMTTGSKYCAIGPNDTNNKGIQNAAPGLSLFNTAFNVESYDASVITFDVVPNGSTLKINYVFGSEEYGESNLSTGYEFNDAFGIFISGPGINGTVNIARLPSTNSVSIRTLNPSTNNQYLIDNGLGTNSPFNSSSQYLQYDGLSIPLTATKSNLLPGSTYHVILVIADGGDSALDSGVFLEEGAVTAEIDETTLDNFVTIGYNSSTKQATIQVTEYPGNLTYQIVDLSGKTMVQSNISENTIIDLNDYPCGVYFIRVEGSNGQVTKKVVR